MMRSQCGDLLQEVIVCDAKPGWRTDAGSYCLLCGASVENSCNRVLFCDAEPLWRTDAVGNFCDAEPVWRTVARSYCVVMRSQ